MATCTNNWPESQEYTHVATRDPFSELQSHLRHWLCSSVSVVRPAEHNKEKKPFAQAANDPMATEGCSYTLG